MKTKQLTDQTIAHYEANPQGFWEGTQDHDVSQNYNALLSAIKASKVEAPFNILDFGCGPGRDLKHFDSVGHNATGLDGSESFCKMAKEHSGCEVLNQNFVDIDLPDNHFNGVFANASMFHVPKVELVNVINKLQQSLKEDGILFSSNPRPDVGVESKVSKDVEGLNGNRYYNYMHLESYQNLIESCGFKLIDHYFRPNHMPVAERPWLACVFKKI